LTTRALRNADLREDEVDFVLMAGNSSALPAVQAAMTKLFGADRVLRKIHPKHCVAMGAAIVADMAPAAAADAATEAEPKIKLGGIAPFHYGTQSQNDAFNVFIRKGDPFPTEDKTTLTFATGMPDQRIVDIPVYGGDDLQKASRNEKQGEAFVVLPSGLPRDTAVRISLWLDGDGVFSLAAALEDGRALDCWIVRGEADARAIEIIEAGEKALADKRSVLQPEEAAPIEALRNEAFAALGRRDFGAALDTARRFEQAAVAAAATVGTTDAVTGARNAIGFLNFVVQQYGSVLDGQLVYDVKRRIAEAGRACDEKRLEALPDLVAGLQAAFDGMPDTVKLGLGLRNAVLSRIRPYDPSRAQRLVDELQAIEKGAAGKPPMMAILELGTFAQKVEAAVKELPQAAAMGCPACGTPLRGARVCTNCGEDSWLPRARHGAQTAGA